MNDPVALTLGNSRMSGFALAGLFSAINKRLNASRLKTLESDADTTQELDDLERHHDNTNQG